MPSTSERLHESLPKSQHPAHLTAAELAALPGPTTERIRARLDPRLRPPARQCQLEDDAAALARRSAILTADRDALGRFTTSTKEGARNG